MGLYEDQLAKAARTQEFLQRQIDLSDENKSDVLDALINNTWGTQNQFYIGGNPVDKSDTSINLELFLKERGIDPNNIPEFVGSDIFRAEKLIDTRALSQIVPIGAGIDLREVAEIERSTLLGINREGDQVAIADLRQFIANLKSKNEDTNSIGIIPDLASNSLSFNKQIQANGGVIPFFDTNMRIMGRPTIMEDRDQTTLIGGSAGILIALAIAMVGF